MTSPFDRPEPPAAAERGVVVPPRVQRPMAIDTGSDRFPTASTAGQSPVPSPALLTLLLYSLLCLYVIPTVG